MNYLQDKKAKRKKIFGILSIILVLIIFISFRSAISGGFSYISHNVFRPFMVFGNNTSGKLGTFRSFFATKNSLINQNSELTLKLAQNEAKMVNYNSILAENESLKEILGRKSESDSFVLAAILGKPNQSPYDTLVIDVGANQDIKEKDPVFALGNIPIGRISSVYPNSSNVVLFSNTGEKTEVIVSGKPIATQENNPEDRDVFLEAVGRGGGNLEIILPRDFAPEKGDQTVLPGITPFVVGIVETIISDPRDPFVKALLISPVNIQELKFVEVKKR